MSTWFFDGIDTCANRLPEESKHKLHPDFVRAINGLPPSDDYWLMLTAHLTGIHFETVVALMDGDNIPDDATALFSSMSVNYQYCLYSSKDQKTLYVKDCGEGLENLWQK